MNKHIIHSVFDHLATGIPDSIAIQEHTSAITYGALSKYSNRIANGLLQHSVNKGDVVGAFLDSGIDYVGGILGINKAGGVFMPLQANYPVARLVFMINVSQPNVVITAANNLDVLFSILENLEVNPVKTIIVLKNIQEPIITISLSDKGRHYLEHLYSDSDPAVAVNGDDPNYLLFTSGSTGDPKGILGCHKSLSHFIHWEKSEFRLDSHVKVSQLAPLSFDVSLRDIFLPLLTGGTLCVPDPEIKHHPARFLEWVKTNKVTLMHLVPSLFRQLTVELQYNDQLISCIDSLQFMFLAGEKLYAKDVCSWRAVAGERAELINLYGPTETTLAKVFNRIGKISDKENDIIPLGDPISNTLVLILNNTNGLCNFGEIGEICIKTPFRSRGYYNDEALTAQKFVQNPLHNDYQDIIYRTGDLGKYLPDQKIAIIGRQDTQVKIRGNRVELSEVEKTVMRFTGVDQAIILAVPKAMDDLVLVCYYTQAASVDRSALREFISGYLPEYMLPSHYVLLDAFPLNLNGKVDKKALPKAEDVLYHQLDYTAPASSMERSIAGIFSEVLGLQKIGVNNSFFELGGHSLFAIRILARIHKNLNKRLSLKDFLSFPTVRGVSGLLERKESDTLSAIEPIIRQPDYELSHAQKRLWIEQQLDLKSAAYNISAAWQLQGDLHVFALQDAFASLVERHESLRTTFVNIAGEPRQVVHDHATYDFELHYSDLCDQNSIESKVKSLVQEQVQTVFDLSNGPLIRADLWRVKEKGYVFSLTMHHIISDGWSMQVLIDEVLSMYEAYRQGKPNPLLPLQIQYKDYAHWQQQQLKGEPLAVQKQYWHERFSGEFSALELPTDYARPPVKTFKGDRAYFTIDSRLTKQVKMICEKYEVTLFNVVLTLTKVLLHKYTGQKDIVVGTPVAGRNHIDLEGQIGFYVNMLALRTKFESGLTFRELLLQVKEENLLAYSHDLYPFDRLIEELGLERDVSRSNLFDVVVQLKERHVHSTDASQLHDLTVEPFVFNLKSSKYDLLFDFIELEEEGRIQVCVDYNTDLFKPATITDSMQRDLVEVVSLIVANQDIVLSDISLSSKRNNYNDFLLPVNKLALSRKLDFVHSTFENVEKMLGKNTAVQEEGKSITYSGLNSRSNRLAHLLRDLGVSREYIVGVMMPSGIDLVTSLLSILKAGGVYLPMDISFSQKRFTQIFSHSRPKVVIVNKWWEKEAKEVIRDLGLSGQIVVVIHEDDSVGVLRYAQEDEWTVLDVGRKDYPIENPVVINDEDDGSYLFYTSGSTGEGKAILGCHKGLSHFIEWQKNEFNINEHYRVSQLTQLTFDPSLRDMFLPLCSGATVCIPPRKSRENISELIAWLDSSGITLMHCVPTLFRLITKELKLQGSTERLKSLRLLFLAGEIVYSKDILNWRSTVGNHVELVNLYGPTETTLAKFFNRIGEVSGDASQIVAVGKPISNTVGAIINDKHLCRVGEIGDIYIKTPFWSKGYYNNPELTASVFVQNPLITDQEDIVYKTGDIGRYLSDRSIEVLGRRDDQVKVNGIRVELKEIELSVLGVSGVEEVVIVAHRNSDSENELICYYTGKVDSDTIRGALKKTISENVYPSYFVPLEQFPVNLNGKIDKRALPKPEEVLIGGSEYEPVTNELEGRLEEIWKEVLGFNRIGRRVSFFKIGGTSLKALKVISRIQKEFNVAITIADLFCSQTIGELVSTISGRTKKIHESIVPLKDKQPHYELSHAQKRLWIEQQLDPGSTAYNISSAWMLQGDLHVSALQDAFASLVERHESLRTTFVDNGGEPRQVIIEPSSHNFTIHYSDLCSDENAEVKVKEYVQSHVQTSFDLSAGPLLRADLWRVTTENYVFALTMHHIISDGWSMQVLINEVLSMYEAYRQGKPNPLLPLQIHYKDYAHWQQQQLQGEQLEVHKQYWHKRFAGEIPVLAFPTDYPRPVVKTFNGDRVYFTIDAELTRQLKTTCVKHEVTLFVAVLTLTKLLLHKYTGQKDIVVGTPVAGRNHIDLEGQIGFYVNMLALRTKFESGLTFRELLLQVKEENLLAYSHDLYPFDRLIEELGLERDVSRSNLFDVVVQLKEHHVHSTDASQLHDLTVEPFVFNLKSSKYDLLFDFIELEEEGQIQVCVDYNTDLFKPATITETVKKDLLEIISIVSKNTEVALVSINFSIDKSEENDYMAFLKPADML